MSKGLKWVHVKTKEVLVFESQVEAAKHFGYKTKYAVVKADQSEALFLGCWKVFYLSSGFKTKEDDVVCLLECHVVIWIILMLLLDGM